MSPRRDPNEIHRYAGGEIESRRGRVNTWLLVVYVALGAWAVWYLIAYWSGG